MRVIYPYTSTHPGAVSALNETGKAWEPHDVSGDKTSYAQLLGEIWKLGKSFVVIEQDIVINPDTLDIFASCGHDWCAFSYPFGYGQIEGLGCTRFSSDLLLRRPDALERTWDHIDPKHPAGHWCALDARLNHVLSGYGEVRHVHAPPVGHLRPMPSHRLCGSGMAD